MSFGSGRKRGYEWGEVSEVDKNTVKSDYCELKISKKVERIPAHLEKCKTRKGKQYEPEYNVESLITSSSVASTASDMSNVLVSVRPISTPTQASKLKPSNLNNFVFRTSTYEKDSLDKQVTRFFFSSNLSFNSVEGPEFQKLCLFLPPGYIPPNRKKLGEELLDDVYNDLSIKISKELENKTHWLSAKIGGQAIRMIQLLPT